MAMSRIDGRVMDQFLTLTTCTLVLLSLKWTRDVNAATSHLLSSAPSSVIRANTYSGPHSIDPTTGFYDYQYGYQYVNDGSWTTAESALVASSCFVLDYSLTSASDHLQLSVLYSLSAGLIAPTNHIANLSLIIVRDNSYSLNKSSFTITHVLDVTIPSSTTATGLIYFFRLDQLIEVNANDYLGYCDHGDNILSYNTYGSSAEYVYQWRNDNNITLGSSTRSFNTSHKKMDLRVHGWSGVTLDQLNLTAVNQFLSSEGQTAGGVRVTQSTPTDSSSSGGGLSTGGQIALIVCLVLVGIGLLAIKVWIVLSRPMRRPPPTPAPRSEPPNQHVPAMVNAGRIQPKPSEGSVSSPLLHGQAAAGSVPMVHPYQHQPVIYDGNQEGISINLSSPSSPPNPYVFPSSPAVSPSSIELHHLNRPPVSFSSIENDIPNQPPPQYDPTIKEVEGQESVNIHWERPSAAEFEPGSYQPHHGPFSSIQPAPAPPLIYQPTTIARLSPPLPPPIYSVSSSVVTPTPVSVGVIPTSAGGEGEV